MKGAYLTKNILYYAQINCDDAKYDTKLKLVSPIFHQIFIFSPNDSPSKTVKNVF